MAKKKTEKLRCFVCGKPIRKGAKYWTLGPMITCEPCHTYIHG